MADTKKPKPPTDSQLAARYGYALSFFNAYPELRRLLAQAKKKNWDTANFQSAIRNTKWWKSRSASQREYDTMRYTDPAQLKAKIQDSTFTIQQQAAAMGLNLSDSALRQMSAGNVRDGMTPAELQKAMAQAWYKQWQGNNEKYGTSIDSATGAVGQAVSQIREMASAYGMPISDAKVAEAAYHVVAGNQQVAFYEKQYKEWAKREFAGVADLIDAGQSVQDLLDPYAQIAAQELGLGRDQISAMDPRWQAALNGGQGAPLTLNDWRTRLRTDTQYGWESSDSARQAAYQMASGLAQMFQGG